MSSSLERRDHLPAAAPFAPESPALESQQTLLLELLHESRDRRASFAELRDAGIEFPASIVSELELLGAPVSRCALRADGQLTPGVRLDEPARAEPWRPA